MAEPLKYIYNQAFFDRFTTVLQNEIPSFDRVSFLKTIYNDEWEMLELKQRMRHITLALKSQLTGDFEQNIQTIINTIPKLKANGFKDDRLAFIIYPDFVEVYGLEHYEVSMAAMEQITQFVTCEFAIRPFLMRYEAKVMKQMLIWSTHQHESVRRFASEGCRPRLPWAMAIPTLKQNPSSILPILENLKNDSSEYVRRSVANNLNDISKDHPDTVIALTKKWIGSSTQTDKLLKHACRTLLKKGHVEVMPIFGYGSVEQIEIIDFNISTPTVKIGDAVEFSFTLLNQNDSDTLIRLEYGLYFQKANGTLSRKVFKISEKIYAAHSKTTIFRKQSFKVITTRKLHVGLHQVSIIINGVEFKKHDFELVKN